MKKLLLLFISTILFSCSTDDTRNCCVIIDLSAVIKYESGTEKNILVSEDYKFEDIEVFHKINGNWEKYYKANLDQPRGLRKVEMDSLIYLQVHLSGTTSTENISGTKLKFPNGEEDIIEALIDKTSGNMIVKKIWYNDDLKWTAESKSPAEFTVLKE